MDPKKDSLAKKTGKDTAIEQNQSSQIVAPPTQQIKKMSDGFSGEIAGLIQLSGTIDLNPKQKEALFSAAKDEDIEIRPDGLIYLPWMEYVTRLRDVFGMRWALIPEGLPKQGPGGNSIMWGFWLILDGKPYGYAIGEQEYFPNNPAMSWSDACEGAKSNALMRLCKGVGISLELWRPSFIREWKKKHATYVWKDVQTQWGVKRKQIWSKKESEKDIEEKEEIMPDKEKIQEAVPEAKKEQKNPPDQPKTKNGRKTNSPPQTVDPLAQLKVEVRSHVETLVEEYERDEADLLDAIRNRIQEMFGILRGNIPGDLSEKELAMVLKGLKLTIEDEKQKKEIGGF